MDGKKNIKVIARFRPENTKESAGGSGIVNIESDQTCKIASKDFKGEFTFDRVFGAESTQQQVFDYSLKQTVDDLLNGYNGTVFAYGQTGSGKSHTMMGPDIEDPVQRGAIPRMVDQIFERIVNSSDSDVEYMVRVSYMEIYMEKIKDLLCPTKDNLAIHEDKTRGIHVKNLTEEYVSSAQEVYSVMQQGARLRAVASTNMNQESSRSHSIFVVVVSQKNLTTGTQKSGQLFLVDLAGSEKVGKTGASGQTLEEAKKINKSLSALGNVINSLTDGKSSHIPYRDSKLTRILQESLGGNSRTSLIVNCSPSSLNDTETISTLRFGVRAKTIKNKARVNTELSPAELRSMLKSCQEDLESRNAYVKQLEKELRAFKKNGQQEPSSPSSTTSRTASPVNGQSSVGLGINNDPTSGNKNHDEDEYMQRENELQDQIVERDAIIEQQEQEIAALKSNQGLELERLKYEKEEMEVRLEAMINNRSGTNSQRSSVIEASSPEIPQTAATATSSSSPTLLSTSPQLPSEKQQQSPILDKKRRLTAELLGEYYQKGKSELVDDALTALSSNDLDSAKDSLLQLQKLPEYRYEKVMEEDRESFKTLVEDFSNGNGTINNADAGDGDKVLTSGEVYDAKIRAHEDTILKLMNQNEELSKQNHDLHSREKTSGNLENFEKVKQSLMRDLQDRCERIVELEISLDQARDQYNYAIKSGVNKTQHKKMALLERNLEQLTSVQKQLVSQNKQLKKEAAVATKLLTSRNDRINELESSKQSLQQQLEQEQLQFANQLKYLTDRIYQSTSSGGAGSGNIVKPIRGGSNTSNSAAASVASRASGMWNKISNSISG